MWYSEGVALGTYQGDGLALKGQNNFVSCFAFVSPFSGNAVKHFSTDFVRVALALPVVCHPITGYDTGKASATQDKYFCQKAAQNAPQRSLSGRPLSDPNVPRVLPWADMFRPFQGKCRHSFRALQ